MNDENGQAVELKERASKVMEWAQGLVVASKADQDSAIATLAGVKGVRAAWVAYWKPIKDAAAAAHKGICAKEKEGTEIVDKAETIVKSKLLTWQQAERAKAEAEQRRLQAIADECARKTRERMERDAARLKSIELKQERLAQADAVVAPVVAVVADTATAGCSVSVTWKAELVDLDALIAAASPGSTAASMLCFEQRAADSFAKATKGKVQVPGVRFVAVETMSVKAK